MEQDIFRAIDALLMTGNWDKLVLLTSVENMYSSLVRQVNIPIVVISSNHHENGFTLREFDSFIPLHFEFDGIEDLLNLSISLAITGGCLSIGDRVILLGVALGKSANLLALIRIYETPFSDLCRIVTDPSLPDASIIMAMLTLAMQLSRMRKEPAGALYVIGDMEHVLPYCTQLFMNPFEGHPADRRNVMEARVRDTLREYARLDGAVLIDDKGFIQSAGVHINADMRGVDIPIEGTRHAVAAAITHQTNAIAIIISEKTGVIMLFRSGRPLIKVGL